MKILQIAITLLVIALPTKTHAISKSFTVSFRTISLNKISELTPLSFGGDIDIKDGGKCSIGISNTTSGGSCGQNGTTGVFEMQSAPNSTASITVTAPNSNSDFGVSIDSVTPKNKKFNKGNSSTITLDEHGKGVFYVGGTLTVNKQLDYDTTYQSEYTINVVY